jgi:hypothetical protein
VAAAGTSRRCGAQRHGDGAQADELSELKAQLEALQSRVGQLEQQPSMAALPEGASFLTLTRGSADITDRTPTGAR